MAFDSKKTLEAIRNLKFVSLPPRPRVLFDAAELLLIRERAAARPGLVENLRTRADALLKTNAETVNTLQSYISGAEALGMSDAYLVTQNEAYARWIKTRLASMMKLDTWRAPVHGTMVCDHCMGNIAAHSALAYDAISNFYTPAESDKLVDALRRHILIPFLAATGNDPIWWFKKETESNWKIMTCGEAGVAFCAFADRWPEAPEAIARAATGVLQTFDAVPAEGDWPEGFGYWFATLQMGLRFARVLRKLTRGEIDLFQHPSLKVTGNYAVHLCATGGLGPGGRVYNFNDNVPQPDERSIEAIAMLAYQHRRGDWMTVARKFPAQTPIFLACDDPAVQSTHPPETLGYFPRTGIATMRTGWNEGDTFVGFKSGPSAVGHSHLDANTFLIESKGQRLINDYPYWTQAHFIGFFDSSKLRWNFDGNATVGHNTLLVDGKGQTHGVQHAAFMRRPRTLSCGAQLAVGDASLAYPGLLRKFVRSILLLATSSIIIRDVVVCEGERHLEWLLHYAGTIRTVGRASVIETGGAAMSVTPFLPDRSNGWRTSDVTRTSEYVGSDALRDETLTIRYRSFAPFQQTTSAEFLFALEVGDTGGKTAWQFEGAAGKWTLQSASAIVRPEGDELIVV